MAISFNQELFPDAKVVRDGRGKTFLLLDVETSLEKSMKSIAQFGIVVMVLTGLFILVSPFYGILSFVPALNFYLFVRYLDKRTQAYYLLDAENRKMIYHLELPIYTSEKDYLSFDDFTCVGVRGKYEIYGKKKAGLTEFGAFLAGRHSHELAERWQYQLIAVTTNGKIIELGTWREGGFSLLNDLAKSVSSIMETEYKPINYGHMNKVKYVDNKYLLVNRPKNIFIDTQYGNMMLLTIILLASFIVWPIIAFVFGIEL